MQISYQFLQTQDRLSFDEIKLMEFYPDTIPYLDDETSFQHNWQMLTSKKGYLFVDGYQIKRVSHWRYYLEWFRGKLGFENHCNETRVELSLLKYSYYGLTRGFVHTTSLLSSDDEEQTQRLVRCQQKLVDYYRDHQRALQPSFWVRFFYAGFSLLTNPLQNNFIFGDSMASLSMNSRQDNPSASVFNLQLVLQLKPSSPLFVPRYIELIVDAIPPEKAPRFIQPNSAMGVAVANKYMTLAQEKLNPNTFRQWMTFMGNAVSNFFRAKTENPWLEWHRYAQAAKAMDDNIEGNFLRDFINYELHQKNYERAYQLILKLNNVNEQIQLINSDQHRKHLMPLIKKDTPLARTLAEHYLSMAKKSYFGKTQLFEEASQLASADLDPQYFIQQLIDQKKYSEAKLLYKQYSTVDLAKTYRNKLASCFSQEGVELYQKGKLQKDLHQREHYYRLSLQAKKRAAGLATNDSTYEQDVNVYRRLVAQSIFDRPMDNEEKRIAQLDNAIKKYEKSYRHNAKTYDPHLVPSLVAALMERASIAMQHCLDPNYDEGHSASQDHQELAKDYLPIAITNLTRALQILDKQSNLELWAKLQFMLGDIKRFFEMDGYIHHLKAAADAVPENPFYMASVAEISGNQDDLDAAWNMFVDVGLPATRYFDWKGERWNKDKIFSKDLGDIHQYKVDKPSILKNIFGNR